MYEFQSSPTDAAERPQFWRLRVLDFADLETIETHIVAGWWLVVNVFLVQI